MASKIGNFLGAFADGAVLFPLIAALSLVSGFSSIRLFASAGLLYLCSGYYFRIPMPVQPLKALAIAAVVSGASYTEVRAAGAAIGLLCLLFLLLPVDKIAKRIPAHLVHGIQLSLGLLLLRRGLETFLPLLSTNTHSEFLLVLSLSTACLVLGHYSGLSALGLLAAGGALIGITKSSSPVLPSSLSPIILRWNVVLALVLPQIILTGANSVIATRDAAIRYFGRRAERVTLSSLLGSIAFGNILMAALGGLPFCHGSGGMTAQVRGGSTHWGSNFVIGFFLLGLAFCQFFWGSMELRYPPALLALLLGFVGIYHLQLALPSWKFPLYRPTLFVMGGTALFSQNLIYALLAGTIANTLTSLLFPRQVVA